MDVKCTTRPHSRFSPRTYKNSAASTTLSQHGKVRRLAVVNASNQRQVVTVEVSQSAFCVGQMYDHLSLSSGRDGRHSAPHIVSNRHRPPH